VLVETQRDLAAATGEEKARSGSKSDSKQRAEEHVDSMDMVCGVIIV
jgi:hypothetical protein